MLTIDDHRISSERLGFVEELLLVARDEAREVWGTGSPPARAAEAALAALGSLRQTMRKQALEDCPDESRTLRHFYRAAPAPPRTVRPGGRLS